MATYRSKAFHLFHRKINTQQGVQAAIRVDDPHNENNTGNKNIPVS